jgi:3-oxoacyl-[acyl-carrier protein] reductase
MADELRGKVAIVTGGGKGIGREIAEGLARAGAAVTVTGRSLDALQDTVSTIENAGGRALALAANVTDKASIAKVVADTEAKFGPIDILVSNAGIEGPLGPLWLNDTDAWERCLMTNVMGSVIVAQSVLPGMVERKSGRIIFVGSGGGLWPVPYDTGYAVTKAGLIRLGETLAIEAEEHNVYCWVIHPGVVHTNMSNTVMDSPDGRKWLPGYEQALARGTTPIEWASELTTFLASGAADGLTGRFLSVNDDYRDLAKKAAEIKAGDLLTLRLNHTPQPPPPRPFQ